MEIFVTSTKEWTQTGVIHRRARPGTLVGHDCVIDSRVSSSGEAVIGNHVTLRYDTIVARGCRIGDHTYLSPRVMTNNLDSGGVSIGGAY